MTQNKDCLVDDDFFSGRSTSANYEDCRAWCSFISDCGGFTVYENVCYFKRKTCKDNLVQSEGRSVFILQNKGKDIDGQWTGHSHIYIVTLNQISSAFSFKQ